MQLPTMWALTTGTSPFVGTHRALLVTCEQLTVVLGLIKTIGSNHKLQYLTTAFQKLEASVQHGILCLCTYFSTWTTLDVVQVPPAVAGLEAFLERRVWPPLYISSAHMYSGTQGSLNTSAEPVCSARYA